MSSSRPRSRSQAELKTKMTELAREKKYHTITAEISLQKIHFKGKKKLEN
jgi:hypothetical protein